MSLYLTSLFLHIVGALTLFAVLSLEWAALGGLRRATTVAQARDWARLLGAQRVGGLAALTVLLTGIHLSVDGWGPQAWILVGLATMATIAVLGPVLGAGRIGAIRQALSGGDGAIPGPLGRQLRDHMLALSIQLRTALFLGIVFLMVEKPRLAGALVAIGVAVVLGLAPALASRRSGRSSVATASPAA